MINFATQTSLRDAMSLAKAVPDAELLDEFTRRYPQHADALTEFAIELAIDSLMHRDDEEDILADADTVSSVVSRVMSQFENQLYERRQRRATTPPARAATASVENPFVTFGHTAPGCAYSPGHSLSCWSSAFASSRSGVSKPSVNQP
jgi:hypothetical protein